MHVINYLKKWDGAALLLMYFVIPDRNDGLEVRSSPKHEVVPELLRVFKRGVSRAHQIH